MTTTPYNFDYYIPLTDRELSQRKLEDYAEFSKVVQWGRKNPSRFAEHMFGTQLMDFQRWIIDSTWGTLRSLWLCCRGASKTTMAAIYYMTLLMLIPGYHVYVSTLSAAQSAEVFKKLEDIALRRDSHFRSLTDIFSYELERDSALDTGFTHNLGTGYHFRLFNNSEYRTLSSNINTLRGKRGAVFFDETAWQTADQFAVVENLINVDSSFGTSTKQFELHPPINMPLQILFASSAGDVDFPFYDKYKEYSKKMLAGNKDYFVCDLDANAIMYHSTINGQPIKSHLTKEVIEQAVKEDPERARRELYNKFGKGGGEDAVLCMDTVIKNGTTRPPLLYNDTGKKKFIFCYDPARAYDNSILSIFQLIKDKDVGYKLRLENVVSMVDIESDKKTPLPMPKQLEIIKDLMIRYNGEQAAEWENIEFYIDAGSGGGGVSAVADNLMSDWTDDKGKKHRGIIDPEHKQYETSRAHYKQAVPIVHLVEPRTHKVHMFDALEKMTKFGLVDFPTPLYDGKEYILIPHPKNEDELIEYSLSWQERLALTQCKLMVNETLYVVRSKSANGIVSYDLTKEKRGRMHDDRAYTLAMACFALSNLRRESIVNAPKKHVDVGKVIKFPIRVPKIRA